MKNNKNYKEIYQKTHYKQLKVDVKPADYNYIDYYCKSNGISKAALIIAACRDYIGRTGWADYTDNNDSTNRTK